MQNSFANSAVIGLSNCETDINVTKNNKMEDIVIKGLFSFFVNKPLGLKMHVIGFHTTNKAYLRMLIRDVFMENPCRNSAALGLSNGETVRFTP